VGTHLKEKKSGEAIDYSIDSQKLTGHEAITPFAFSSAGYITELTCAVMHAGYVNHTNMV